LSPGETIPALQIIDSVSPRAKHLTLIKHENIAIAAATFRFIFSSIYILVFVNLFLHLQGLYLRHGLIQGIANLLIILQRD
jgi:hypothetical protein